MGKNTTIEWTCTVLPDGTTIPGNTFNPWIGCTKVSDGCKFCYAEADMDKRRGRAKWGVNGTRSLTSQSYWGQPLAWDANARRDGVKTKVFCASLADVFEDFKGTMVNAAGQEIIMVQPTSGAQMIYNKQGVPDFQAMKKTDTGIYEGVSTTIIEANIRYIIQPLTLDIVRAELFKIIERTKNLIWIIVTKRPENIMQMVPEHWKTAFPENIWILTSVENQEQANERILHLIDVPAKVRGLSCEPLLGPIDFYKTNVHLSNLADPEWRDGRRGEPIIDCLQHIHWVIVGGESGHNARIMHPTWVASIRDQCENAKTAFFFKQWGEWSPAFYGDAVSRMVCSEGADCVSLKNASNPTPDVTCNGNIVDVYRIGKKEAGNLIDGVKHINFPI